MYQSVTHARTHTDGLLTQDLRIAHDHRHMNTDTTPDHPFVAHHTVHLQHTACQEEIEYVTAQTVSTTSSATIRQEMEAGCG